MSSASLKPLLHGPTLQTPVSEFISKELRTPDNFVADLNLGSLHKDMSGGATSSAACNYFTSAYTSGYQVGPLTQFGFVCVLAMVCRGGADPFARRILFNFALLAYSLSLTLEELSDTAPFKGPVCRFRKHEKYKETV